jgi:hypothetical protein
MKGMEQLSNPFYSPFSAVTLIKGVEEDGKWMVYLQASNELTDQDGEVVESGALKKAKDYYLSNGVLSWDHKHKVTGDPEFIIGEPTDVQFTDSGETLVKGWLYQHNKKAQSVWNNIRSGAKRLGASIGGGILQKAENSIKKVVWDETAITHKPVNSGTMGNVQMVPFPQFAKALTAGGGVDAASFVGGRALTPESLQGSTVNAVSMTDVRGLFSDLLKGIRDRQIVDYNDMLNFVYDRGYTGNNAARIVNYIARKVPNVVGSGG